MEGINGVENALSPLRNILDHGCYTHYLFRLLLTNFRTERDRGILQDKLRSLKKEEKVAKVDVPPTTVTAAAEDSFELRTQIYKQSTEVCAVHVLYMLPYM